MLPLELILKEVAGDASLGLSRKIPPRTTSGLSTLQHQQFHHFGRVIEEAFLKQESIRCDRSEHSNAFHEAVVKESHTQEGNMDLETL